MFKEVEYGEGYNIVLGCGDGIISDLGVWDIGDNHAILELSVGYFGFEEALAETFRLSV